MKRFEIRKIVNGVPTPTNNLYLVVNVDEPYAERVFDIIQDHERHKKTWDGPVTFEEFVEELRGDPLPEVTPPRPIPPAMTSFKEWLLKLCEYKQAGVRLKVADNPMYRYLGFKPFRKPEVYVTLTAVKDWPQDWAGPHGETWGSYQPIYDVLKLLPMDLRTLIRTPSGRKQLIETPLRVKPKKGKEHVDYRKKKSR